MVSRVWYGRSTKLPIPFITTLRQLGETLGRLVVYQEKNEPGGYEGIWGGS